MKKNDTIKLPHKEVFVDRFGQYFFNVYWRTENGYICCRTSKDEAEADAFIARLKENKHDQPCS